MFHGGKIALLGIMPDKAAIDWNTVVFSALTIKGIYGREMYETWYKMTAMIQSGLDISPVITHRFPYTRVQGRDRADEVGQLGQDRARLEPTLKSNRGLRGPGGFLCLSHRGFGLDRLPDFSSLTRFKSNLNRAREFPPRSLLCPLQRCNH